MITCPTCQYQNPDGTDICLYCANALTYSCPACGKSNPAGSSVCSSCGKNLHAKDAISVGSTLSETLTEQLRDMMPSSLEAKISAASKHRSAERREVTVLFIAFSGLSPHSSVPDNEDIYLMTNEVVRKLANVIYEYEGTVDKFTGSSLIALFGAPIVHENDPERGARAALDILAAFQLLHERAKDRYGIDLQIGIGIHTGMVLVDAVGNDLRMAYTVVGNTVDLASQLAESAAPGTAQASFVTYQRTHAFLIYSTLTPASVADEPKQVPVYRLIGLQKKKSAVRGLLGLQAPMIGRGEALSLMQAALNKVYEQHQNQVVFITGEAGLGKSRLVSEFRSAVHQPDVQIYEGSCIAYTRSRAMWVIAELVRNIAGITETMPINEQVRVLQSYVRHRLSHGEEALPYLCQMCGLPQPNAHIDSPLDLLDTQMLQRQIGVAVKQVIDAEVQQATTLIILEDLHWMDTASREFIESLLQTTGDLPLMMVLVSRDQDQSSTIRPLIEVAAQNPTSVVDIQLQPLSDAESVLLVDQLLGPVDDEIHAIMSLIVRRAEGVPFYIEELLRILSDHGGIINDGQQWRVTPKVHDLLKEVPGTLRGLILARYDRLSPAARRLLQVASVIWRSFPIHLLYEIARQHEEMTRDQLIELEEHRFLRRESFGTEQGYAFSHVLIQEAVYGTLLRRDRQELHGQAAQAIEASRYWLGYDKVELLAYHYIESPTPLRAIPYLIAAAESAVRRYNTESAIQHYQRAITLMERQVQGNETQLARAKIGLGRAFKFAGNFSAAAEVLRVLTDGLRSEDMVLPGSEAMVLQVEGLRELADVRQSMGALDEASKHLEAALDLLGPSGTLANQSLWRSLLDRLAWVRFRQNRLSEAFALASSATFDSDPAHVDDPITVASLHNTLGGIFWRQDKLGEASEHVERSLDLYRRMGYTFGTANAYTNLGILYYEQGLWQRAFENFDQSMKLRREIGYMPGQALNLTNLGLLYMEMGEHEKARHYLDESLGISRRLGEDSETVVAALGIAQLDIIEGKTEEANACLDLAASLKAASSDAEDILARWLRALVQAALGDSKKGLETVTEALAKAKAVGINKETADCLRVAGMLQRNLGCYAEAEELLKQAIQTCDLHHEVYRGGLSQLELAQTYAEWAASDQQHAPSLWEKAAMAATVAANRFSGIGAAHSLKLAKTLEQSAEVHTASRASTSGASHVEARSPGTPSAEQGEWRSAAIVWMDLLPPKEADEELVFETLSHIVPQLVAVVHDYQGEVIRRHDGLTVVLGAPAAHENDAERAVWVAMRALQIVRQPNNPEDLVLTARVAVSLGDVVAGWLKDVSGQDQTAAEMIVTGPPVQMAQYVAEVATPGKVWVTHAVNDATERVFIYHAPSDPESAALARLSVTELAGLKELPSPSREALTSNVPLVGREAALMAMAALAKNLDHGVGGLVWIEGEAGIGKSRLMHEFETVVGDRAQVWLGQCSPQRSGQAFHLITNLMTHVFGLRPNEEVEQAVRRIDDAFESWPEEARSSRPFIELLVGVDPGSTNGERLASLSPDQLRQQIFVAMRNLLRSIATVRPVVLMLDDLHWVDPMSADLLLFLSNMVATIPILFVCAQRWEENEKPNDRLARMLSLHAVHTLKLFLDRLPLTDSEVLIMALLPEAPVTSQLRTFILERSEGNPYYIEELIRLLIDQDYLRREETGWTIDENVMVGSLPLPQSLGALMRSRVDALPEDLKYLLQCAAVIGSPVEPRLLLPVAGVAGGAELLSRLEARGMMKRVNESSQQWIFSHALLETAVYESMLRTYRQELHLKVALQLESLWTGEQEAHAEELAYHYTQANQPGKSLNYLVVAGERAAGRNANEEALTYFREAIQLIDLIPSTTDVLKWRVVTGLGDTYRLTGEYTESHAILESGLALLNSTGIGNYQRAGLYRRLGETAQKQGLLDKAIEFFWMALAAVGQPTSHDALVEAARITGSQAFTYLLQGRLDRSAKACLTSLDYAQHSGNLVELAAAESVLGGVCYRQGDWKAAFYHTTQAMSIREQMGYTWGVAANKSNLGILAVSAGEWKQAEAFFQQSLEMRQELGDVEGMAITHNNMAALARDQGDLVRAESHLRSSVTISEQLNMPYHAISSKIGQAQVLLLRGKVQAAQALTDICAAEANAIGANDLLTEIRLVRTEVFLVQGDIDEAGKEVEEALTLAATAGNKRLEADGWRLVSQIELQRDDQDAARQALTHGQTIMAEVTDDLEKGRIALQSARVLLSEGNAAEARREMHEARLIFTRLGAALDLATLDCMLEKKL